MAGTRWHIGLGDRINIVGQRWLRKEQNLYITPNSSSHVNNKVNSLMCLNRKEWDRNIIQDLFNERDQQCILNVPLLENNTEDQLYWSKENSRNYSVHSAYSLLQVQKGLWRI